MWICLRRSVDMAASPLSARDKSVVYRIETDDLDQLIESQLKLLNFSKSDKKKKIEALQDQLNIEEGMSLSLSRRVSDLEFSLLTATIGIWKCLFILFPRFCHIQETSNFPSFKNFVLCKLRVLCIIVMLWLNNVWSAVDLINGVKGS